MSAGAAGWMVRIRVWGRDDEHYFAAIPDRDSAEEQVRHRVKHDPQCTVEAVIALTAAELAKHRLTSGKIMLAPKN